MTEPSTGNAALRSLRSKRKLNRLGEVEWFDAAYKVYVAALFGGIALLWLSDLIGDEPLSAAQATDVLRVGPSLMGLVAAVAVAAMGWFLLRWREESDRLEAMLQIIASTDVEADR